MNAAARQIISAALTAAAAIDATITDERQGAALDALEGKPRTVETVTDAKPLDRVLTRAEVAAILKCSTKSVTRYAQQGKIRAVHFGTEKKKALGYSAASVAEALKGATVKPEAANN